MYVKLLFLNNVSSSRKFVQCMHRATVYCRFYEFTTNRTEFTGWVRRSGAFLSLVPRRGGVTCTGASTICVAEVCTSSSCAGGVSCWCEHSGRTTVVLRLILLFRVSPGVSRLQTLCGFCIRSRFLICSGELLIFCPYGRMV
jgi:hypothetical protein